MNYPKSELYRKPEFLSKIMGPNPFMLGEELLNDHQIKEGATVLDLGSGQGVTSVFLAKEYGFKVYAGDLWSDPEENRKFFDSVGLSSERIIPVKADAENLPFESEFFDAVVCIDSYNFFGRDEEYLDSKLVPHVKKNGYIYIALPGLKKDCHDNLPEELLLSWTPELLDYLHDLPWWRSVFEKSNDAELISIKEMECNDLAWKDWLASDNEYAINDRKSMEAGADRHFCSIAAVLRKR
jgi:cyclopropane fatty-acyl-phospholipid synthase-like methyltransferase